MKLQIKTNFSFSKLHNQLDSILNDVVDDAKRLYRASTQENLKSGKLRKLRPASIEARKKVIIGEVKKFLLQAALSL